MYVTSDHPQILLNPHLDLLNIRVVDASCGIVSKKEVNDLIHVLGLSIKVFSSLQGLSTHVRVKQYWRVMSTRHRNTNRSICFLHKKANKLTMICADPFVVKRGLDKIRHTVCRLTKSIPGNQIKFILL